MSRTYSTYDAKARFSEVLRHVRAGERVVISFRGEPVAEIGPYRRAEESFEERWARLQDEGRLVPARPGAHGLGLRPLARRRGALRRFLAERD